MDDTKELVRVLLRRDDILSEIGCRPIRIRELTSRVGVSRPTVHRSLQELKAEDLVEETPSGYVLTAYGKGVLKQYTTVLTAFDEVRTNRSLLLALDAPLPAVVLDGAEFTRALPFAPERPLEKIEDVVGAATKLKAFSPVIIERYVSLFYRKVANGCLEVETLTTVDVYEYLASRWSEELDQALAAGLDVTVVDEPLPFGLVVVEEPCPELCVVIYDEGSFRGVIRTDRREAVEWGHRQYESYRASARTPELLSDTLAD